MRALMLSPELLLLDERWAPDRLYARHYKKI